MEAAFGTQLRDWRRKRGLSQLELSASAAVSQRHLSFLETGRSNPSREMVVHLGEALDVPLRERNLMLAAAGYVPEFGESELGDLEGVRQALRFMVDAHQPYMAIVVDRLWNVVMSNESAMRFARTVLDPSAAWLSDGMNLMRALLHPEGLRSRLSNGGEVVAEMMKRLERDAALHPHDREMQRFVEEMASLAGPSSSMSSSPRLLLPLRYDISGHSVELFSTIATIGAAHDVTLAELRIETFWPVDAASDAAWRQLFA